MQSTKRISLAALMVLAVPLAQANDDHGRREGLGEHPAVLAARHSADAGIDPNHFIVGHPAGGTPSTGASVTARQPAGSAAQHARAATAVVAQR